MPAAPSDTRRAAVALALMALLGIALVFLFPGAPELDTYYHFLQARMAWSDHYYFIGVWSRPLFTVLFALPDRFGFEAGRFLGVAIGVATAWQTWRLARDLDLQRAWLVIPFLLGQPVFFELYPDMLTEPLFGLLFVVAVRWHLRGWTKRALLLASFLPLARPEGFFLGVLWGVWVLADAARGSDGPARTVPWKIAHAIPSTLILLTGTVVWWGASYWISGDPLFIKHNWPSQWHQDMYGHGNFLSYAGRLLEFTGLFLFLPFMVGLWIVLGFPPATLRPRPTAYQRRAWGVLTSAFLLLFILHGIFRAYGLFGEAGYARYMVTVASATAVITLQGWNAYAAQIPWPRFRVALAGGIIALSLLQGFVYLDCLFWERDAIAINDTTRWLREHCVSYKRLICSNAFMSIDLDESLDRSPNLVQDGDNTATLRDAAPGTLVFWDDHLGVEWYHLTVPDIEKCGYEVLYTRHYVLPGYTHADEFFRGTPPFEIQVTLLIKK